MSQQNSLLTRRQLSTQTKKSLFKYQDNKYCFYVDLETTGVDAFRNDIIEICCLVTEAGKFEVIDKFYSKVCPPKLFNSMVWDEGAVKIHGFSREQVKDFTPRRKVLIDFLWFLDKYRDEFPQLFVCHAMASSFVDQKTYARSWSMFDYNFLKWAYHKENLLGSWNKVFNDCYILSTVWLGKEAGFGKDDLYDEDGNPVYTKSGRAKKEGNGLSIWAKRIGFDLEHHKAESDTECCLRVHEYLTNEGF